MITAIAGVTFRGLVARRRFLLMVLLAALPIAVGLLARVAGTGGDPAARTAEVVEMLIVRTVLPLVALVLGTTALGAELEDGTAIHLLTKPVARRDIVAGKLLAAVPPTAALLALSTLATGLLIGGGEGGAGTTIALTVAVAVGALLYVTVFVALSVVTSRALVVGLVYVLLWEGLLAGLFEGTAVLSIREYVLAIAGALDPAGAIAGGSPLSVPTALVGSAVVLVGGFLVATTRLERLELTGGD